MYFHFTSTPHNSMTQVVKTFRCEREINTVINIIPRLLTKNKPMMKLFNRDIFRVTVPLWGESTDVRWTPLKRGLTTKKPPRLVLLAPCEGIHWCMADSPHKGLVIPRTLHNVRGYTESDSMSPNSIGSSHVWPSVTCLEGLRYIFLIITLNMNVSQLIPSSKTLPQSSYMWLILLQKLTRV